MSKKTLNLTPHPRILITITYNPMRPIDALSELIDNSIDSFLEAKRAGHPVDSPTIQISLPKPTEVEKGLGAITVLDNGPGLTLEQTENALSAGYSSHDPYESLGLFGMGFNVSTGKLGERTLFRTATGDGDYITEVVIELPELVKSRTYDVPVEQVEKEPTSFHGTLVEVSGWWPPGNQNFGFSSKLVKLGEKKIKELIGRRYYPILREKKLRIFVNDGICDPFEHCFWAAHRSVHHQKLGDIPAVYNFGKVLHTQVRCATCHEVIDNSECPECGPTAGKRTIEERVRGWVGIQRFDDMNDYGIDLIRNGRVIRQFEKEAFFYWTTSDGRQIMDYPVDGQYGRIIGTVDISHVPTDFMKQDFQRTSPEWGRAMAYLRGETSLQPKKAADEGSDNDSYVYRLFQGYRRVRDFGTADMYMGYWEEGADKPKRISRSTEKEFYDRFLAHEPGYYDDSEWWKLVEQADAKPPGGIKECPSCQAQNLELAEACASCGYIFLGKSCVNNDCSKYIAASEQICPHCGWSQVVEVKEKWRCSYCNHLNHPDSHFCLTCGQERGRVNPLSLEYLTTNSNLSDELSIRPFAMTLPSGISSGSFDVDVYTIATGTSLERDGVAVPTITFKEGGCLKIFVNSGHPLFRQYQQHIQTIVAMEIAKYLQDSNVQQMSGDHAYAWSLPSLCWLIMQHHWKDELAVDHERTYQRAEDFFDWLRNSLPHLLRDRAEEIYDEMPPGQQEQIAVAIVKSGHDAKELGNLIDGGMYLSFLDRASIVGLVDRYPENFFDGNFWDVTYKEIPGIDSQGTVEEIRKVVLSRYRSAMEGMVTFLDYKQKQQRDISYTIWAESTLRLLTAKTAS